jgi:hypothetical protein
MQKIKATKFIVFGEALNFLNTRCKKCYIFQSNKRVRLLFITLITYTTTTLKTINKTLQQTIFFNIRFLQ